MFDIDDTIDAFRRGTLDIDCKRMVLTQRKEGGDYFEGQGYIRQADTGALIFKIYVAKYNAKPFGHLEALRSRGAGKIYGDEILYDLEATARDGTRWTATQILLMQNWDVTDLTVLAHGDIQSVIAHLDMPQHHHYLRLHFFEEYEVPRRQWSKTEKHGNPYDVLDRAEFEACGAKFEVRQREDSGNTVVEVTSETALPVAFDLRIQEALQYLTAKSAFWRARLQSHDKELHLELLRPWPKSARTQLKPPIRPGSYHFFEHGWRLFGTYLAYVTEKTQGTYWNPVAYHLYNVSETTAVSLDVRAVVISVAVEAVAGLIADAGDSEQAEEIMLYRKLALAWLDEQKSLSADIVKRARGQIKAMSDQRPQDILHVLAGAGRVEKNYISAWTNLRHGHVHPKLQGLKKPTSGDTQKLLDRLSKVEVLLRQLTFHLIGYEGPFTDYGVHDFPIKEYPLAIETGSA